MQETVGDIDLVVASERPEEVIDAFFSLTHGTWRKRLSKKLGEGWQAGAIAPEQRHF
jgi:DNA polymerase/3'-5' exonuclease PolX